MHNAARKAFRTKDIGLQKLLIEPLRLSFIHLAVHMEKKMYQSAAISLSANACEAWLIPDIDNTLLLLCTSSRCGRPWMRSLCRSFVDIASSVKVWGCIFFLPTFSLMFGKAT